VRHTRGRVVEVDTLADFDRRLAAGVRALSGWHVQGLDLRDRSEALQRVDVGGALFLDCTLAAGDEVAVRARGAVVYREAPGEPAATREPALYTATRLYDTPEYADSLDARIYAWSQRPRDREASLAQALHDHAVDEALAAWVAGRDLVGVMGGHALERGAPTYAHAARLGHTLGGSYVVATGGGPGAMEAANLGAALSRLPSSELDQALDVLARVPSYRPDIGAWAAAGFEVLEQVPSPADSLGIPTWHYGHEPTNPFATAIAKYFRNATREAILLEICRAGIIFLPGAGGTVQEIFQDACENYYADESSLAPMVLVGREHWTEKLPAWPLLSALARGRPMEGRIHLADSLEEAAALVG
jgi:predicted Rossmann-fold nucleotide-binding protein